MDNRELGQFIAGLRKEKQMTQRELANELHITDKAVSKWERGLSCPDIALLPELAGILDVTVDELLRGERNPVDSPQPEPEFDNLIEYAEKTAGDRVKNFQKICGCVYSVVLLAGALICAICNLAVSGGLTWSLIPISAILYAWIVFAPVIRFGKKGITATMIAATIATVPFLYVLDRLLGHVQLLPLISRKMALIAFVFLWAVYGIFRVLRHRRLLAAAISCLLAIPTSLMIDFSLAKILRISMIDQWDVLTILVLTLLAATFYLGDVRARRGETEKT